MNKKTFNVPGWILALFVWLPVFIPSLAIGLNILPKPSFTALADSYQTVCMMIGVVYLVTLWLDSIENPDDVPTGLLFKIGLIIGNLVLYTYSTFLASHLIASFVAYLHLDLSWLWLTWGAGVVLIIAISAFEWRRLGNVVLSHQRFSAVQLNVLTYGVVIFGYSLAFNIAFALSSYVPQTVLGLLTFGVPALVATMVPIILAVGAPQAQKFPTSFGGIALFIFMGIIMGGVLFIQDVLVQPELTFISASAPYLLALIVASILLAIIHRSKWLLFSSAILSDAFLVWFCFIGGWKLYQPV